MATHSSVLAWRIPGTGEPAGCRLWGRTVGLDWSDLAAAAAVIGTSDRYSYQTRNRKKLSKSDKGDLQTEKFKQP